MNKQSISRSKGITVMKLIKLLSIAILFTGSILLAMDNPSKKPRIDLGKELISAVKASNLERTSSLIEKGASIDYVDEDGFTALIWAAYNGHKAICKLLIDAKANLNFASYSGGNTALIWAEHNSHNEICKWLINAGANVNHVSRGGGTVLMSAIRGRGNYALCAQLIKAGAKVNHADSQGITVLRNAADYGNEQKADLIVQTMLTASDKIRKKTLYTLLLCLKQKNKEFPGIYSKDIRQVLKKPLFILCDLAKIQSITRVRKKISLLPDGPIKQHLLQKFRHQ